eukprot:Hpha_TRINITY_DN29603_c0_g1::TRINITY_DN29603_c0_g1_i1::g.165103::m.165103
MHPRGHFGGPFAVDEPPPPKRCYFPATARGNDGVRPVSRQGLIPQPRDPRDSSRAAPTPSPPPGWAKAGRTGRPVYSPSHTSPRPASAASMRHDTPAATSRREQCPSPGSPREPSPEPRGFRIYPPAQVATETCVRREKRTWAATGFDHAYGSLTTILRRLPPDTPLDEKFARVADLLRQFEVDADTKSVVENLTLFAAQRGGLQDYAGFPTAPRTASAFVALDQLLLHLIRTYPSLKSLVWEVRGAIHDATYIVAPAPDVCNQIPPFEDATNSQEVADHIARFDTRTYYQGVRELTSRLRPGDELAFEKEDRKRDKRSACIDRAVVHWQRQFRGLLLRAWRLHTARRRDLAQAKATERELHKRIQERDAKLRESDQRVWELEAELQKLKDTSELERRLEEAKEMEKQLQRQLKIVREEVVSAEQKRLKLQSDITSCFNVLDAVSDAFRPRGFKEFDLQETISSSLMGRAVTPSFVQHALNQILEGAPEKMRKGTGEPFKIPGFSTPRLLMDPYIVAMHCLSPGVVPAEAVQDCLRREDHDLIGKARQVLFFGKLLGIDLSITPKEFINLFTAPQHLAFSSLLVARLCDPISIDHGARRAQGFFGAVDEPTFSVTKRACFNSFQKQANSPVQETKKGSVFSPDAVDISPRRASFRRASLRLPPDRDTGRPASPSPDRKGSALLARKGSIRAAQGGAWQVTVEVASPPTSKSEGPDGRERKKGAKDQKSGFAGDDTFLSCLALGQGTEESPWNLISSQSFRETKQVSFGQDVPLPEIAWFSTPPNSGADLTAAAASQAQQLGAKEQFAVSADFCQSTGLNDAMDTIMDVVGELRTKVARVQGALQTRWQWNALAHTATRMSTNMLLDKLMARLPTELSPVEELWLASFCNPARFDIDDLLETEPPTEPISLKRTLHEDYRLIRRIFIVGADGDEGDPRVHKEALWRLLDASHVPQAFPRFTRGVYDDLWRRAVRSGTDSVTPSEWMGLIVRVAHFVFATNPTLLLHEKVDWLFDRHIICYATVADPTQCRELVYRTDVHGVVQDYVVQLNAVFNHYSQRKPDIRVDDFLRMLTDCGMLPTRTEYSRGVTEGKLREVKCRDIFINMQVTSGDKLPTTANVSTFIEILVAVAMYSFAHQPYVMLFRLVRRFIEANIILPLRPSIPDLRKYTGEALVSRGRTQKGDKEGKRPSQLSRRKSSNAGGARDINSPLHGPVSPSPQQRGSNAGRQGSGSPPHAPRQGPGSPRTPHRRVSLGGHTS